MANDDYNPETEFANAIHDSASDVPNEELRRILSERFGITDEAPTEQGDSGSGEDGNAGAIPPPTADDTPPPTPSPTIETPPNVFDLGDGITLDRDTARQYAEFATFLRDNPEFAELSKQAFEGVRVAANTPQPIAPPEEIDLDDPVVKFLWDQIQDSNSKLASALQQINSHEVAISTQTNATTESLVNRGVRSFQQQHNLSDDEMMAIRATAARFETLPVLMQPVDPRTGEIRQPDPLRSIEESLDFAMWNMPAFRERAIAAEAMKREKETERKRNLSKLGGSSGSVPRTTPVPTTKEERFQGMVAELNSAMFGNSSEES